MSLFNELRRRRVFRVAGMYAVAAWVVLQVADVVLPPLGLPESSMTLLTVLAILGLPVALVLGWFFDFTKYGIVRTLPAGRAPASDNELKLKPVDFVLLTATGIVVSIVGLGLYNKIIDRTVETAYIDNPPARSIAVLPFVSLSADANTRYFGEGLAEEILNRLARIESLKVMARSASFGLRGPELDIGSIGETLGVETVLEGSVQRAGNQLRVSAQLIDTRDGFQFWSETFNRDFSDIFDVQYEIATAIADELQVEILGSQSQRRPTANLEAYEEYLQGRYFVQFQDSAELQRSFEHFRRATELDPEFAEAWAGMAEARLIRYVADWRYGDMLHEGRDAEKQQAEVEAQPMLIRALSLNPELPDAHASLAIYEWYFANDLDAGLASARRSVEISPNYAPGLKYLGGLLLRGAHQPAEAIPFLEKAHSLDPFDGFAGELLYGAYARNGRAEEAFELIELVLSIEPDNFQALKDYSYALMLRGRMGESLLAANRAIEIEPDDPQAIYLLNEIYMTLDDPAAAQVWLDRMVEVDPDHFQSRVAKLNYLRRIGDFAEYESLLLQYLEEIDLTSEHDLLFGVFYVWTAFDFYTLKKDFDAADRYLAVALQGPFQSEASRYFLICKSAAFYKAQGRTELVDAAFIAAEELIAEQGETITADVGYVYSQAILAATRDKPVEAVALLEQYVELDPAFPNILMLSEPAFADHLQTQEFANFLRERTLQVAAIREAAYAYETGQY